MTAFADLVAEIAIAVGGCPQPLVVRAIRNATITLCERAKVLRQDLDPIDIVANQAQYPLVPPTGLVVVDLRDVLYDGQPLAATSRDALDAAYLAWRRGLPSYAWWSFVQFGDCTDGADSWQSATADQPQVYFQPDPTSIRLVATPDTALAGGLTINAALRPVRAATDAPDWLIEQHFATLVDGALAGLYAIPRKAWSDAALAGYYGRLFDDAVDDAHADALRDGARDDETVGHVVAYP